MNPVRIIRGLRSIIAEMQTKFSSVGPSPKIIMGSKKMDGIAQKK
jgi:hypothetical protein